MDDEPVRGGYPDPSLLAMSGLDRMRASFRGQMPPPPIHHLFGLTPVNAGAASVTFSMPASPWLQTGAGVFLAGTAALVADAPLGGSVMAPLGPGQIIMTSDLSFNFLRPVGVDSGHLIARARPIEIGSRLGVAEALVEDGHGRAVAHCTTRCFIMSLDPPDGPSEPPGVEVATYDTPDPYLRPTPRLPIPVETWEQTTFVEIIDRQNRGEFEPPPFSQLFGITEPTAGEGRFGSSMIPTGWHTSPAGSVYGGVIAYLADSVLTGAFSTTLSTTEIAAPLDLKVQFLRPIFPDGRKLTVEAKVTHRGRNFAVAQARIVNADGKTVALATSSATIIAGRSWGSFIVADESPIPAP
ncbi:MAG: PaaI family thioesterase [Actinomycetota bacterium]|nr:PaaI family thioesterase [Actinomycetota bacterium]